MMPILLVQDAVSIYAYWGKWDRSNLAVLLPGAAVGILIAWLVAAQVSEAGFKIALGTISVLFGLRHLLGRKLIEPARAGPITGAAGLRRPLLRHHLRASRPGRAHADLERRLRDRLATGRADLSDGYRRASTSSSGSRAATE